MDTPDSVYRAQPLLGTFVEIRSAGATRTATERAIDAAFAVIDKIHRLMSFHDRDSDVGRLNHEACESSVAVDPWTYRVLETALVLHRRSFGVFDIAVAPALQRLGLLPRHRADIEGDFAETATSDAIALLPRNHVRFHHPGMKIDLGGIAKGFAVDRAIDILREHDQSYGLVNAGGDLANFGASAETIHIRDPRRPGSSLCQVAIANAALASSARLFDPMESSNSFFSSTVDPMTGEPAAEVAGATVRAPSCMIADALTKIVMIGGKRAAGILKAYQASALFVSAAGDVCVTPEWQDVVRAAA
jgi:thiamine biosynthesis lipoprotein